MSKRVYIVKRGREYLNGYFKFGANRHAVFTVYKYDAVKFDDAQQAKRAALSLMEEGEKWEVLCFDHLTGNEERVWSSR